MAIVTITSDLGNGSYELASLKGTILSKNPEITHLTDISNEIKAFNIVEGAFILSNCFRDFPAGSIHIININPFYHTNSALLVLKKEGHFFIAPNNGILPLLFENEMLEDICEVKDFNNTISLNSSFAQIVDKICNGFAIEEIGKLSDNIAKRISLKAVLSKDTIRGTIIHIDKFGNLISNIRRHQFEKIRAGRNYSIYFRHKDPIIDIKEHYHEVTVGEELCLFTSSGLLEIAINLGNANQVLGIDLDDIIQIDFYE